MTSFGSDTDPYGRYPANRWSHRTDDGGADGVHSAWLYMHRSFHSGYDDGVHRFVLQQRVLHVCVRMGTFGFDHSGRYIRDEERFELHNIVDCSRIGYWLRCRFKYETVAENDERWRLRVRNARLLGWAHWILRLLVWAAVPVLLILVAVWVANN